MAWSPTKETVGLNRHFERSEAIHRENIGINGLLRRFAPRNDDKRRDLLVTTRVSRSARESAAVLFLGGGDRFQIFVGTRYRWARGEDVPLIFDLVGGQRRDRIHFVHQLMIRAAEVAFPRLQNI